MEVALEGILEVMLLGPGPLMGLVEEKSIGEWMALVYEGLALFFMMLLAENKGIFG